jgi:hypothetical protein
MLKKLVLAALVGLSLSAAHVQAGVRLSIGFSLPIFAPPPPPRPVYVVPPPVYVVPAPAPVYVQPAPRPVNAPPAPAYVQPSYYPPVPR